MNAARAVDNEGQKIKRLRMRTLQLLALVGICATDRAKSATADYHETEEEGLHRASRGIEEAWY